MEWLERDEVFLSMDRQDIINWSVQNGISWPECRKEWWLKFFFIVSKLPTASASDREKAARYVINCGGQIEGNRLYHEMVKPYWDIPPAFRL